MDLFLKELNFLNVLLSMCCIRSPFSAIFSLVFCEEPDTSSIFEIVGMMPKSRASPEQIETYLNQERSKRREMLQKFLDQCRKFQVSSWTSSLTVLSTERVFQSWEQKTHISFFWYIQVTVDVYLIESDQIANAIIELVPVLHIKQLVLGISKSSVR